MNELRADLSTDVDADHLVLIGLALIQGSGPTDDLPALIRDT